MSVDSDYLQLAGAISNDAQDFYFLSNLAQEVSWRLGVLKTFATRSAPVDFGADEWMFVNETAIIVGNRFDFSFPAPDGDSQSRFDNVVAVVNLVFNHIKVAAAQAHAQANASLAAYINGYGERLLIGSFGTVGEPKAAMLIEYWLTGIRDAEQKMTESVRHLS